MPTFVSYILGAAYLLPAAVFAQDLFTAPDVRFMALQQAQATMREAGFLGRFEEDDRSSCGSVVDDRIVELGHVCHQVPYPGKQHSKKTWVQLRIQREDPRVGRIGEALEWRLVPKLVGTSEQEALAALREAGFTVPGRIRISHVVDFNCQAGRVCRTYPAGFTRAGVHSDMHLVLGK